LLESTLALYDIYTAREVKDVPNEPHYAALVETSHTYDDGYGSRGSPSTTTARSLDYVVIGNDEQLKAWIIEADAPKYGSPKIYKIVRMAPVVITKHVEISLTPT
jgi:hypothetical protein